jgi:hypothetical protein
MSRFAGGRADICCVFGSVLRKSSGWLVGVVVLGLVSALDLQRYTTNDDAALQALASGMLTGVPEARLVFTNSLIGGLIAGCYALCKHIDWYPIYLNLSLLAAFGMLWGAHDTADRILFRRVLVLGLVVSAIWLHFTSVAIWCGVAACAGLARAHTRGQWLGAVGLGIWAGMMRDLGGVFILALIIPVAVSVCRTPRAWIRVGSGVGICTAVVVCLYWLDVGYVYSRPEWAAFSEHNWWRGKLQGMERLTTLADNRQLLTALGWQPGDLAVFQHWLTDTHPPFDTATLRQLNTQTQYFAPQVWTGGMPVVKSFVWKYGVLIGLAVGCFGLGGRRRYRTTFRWRVATAGLVIGWCVGLGLFLSGSARLPWHVGWVMLATVGLCGLWCGPVVRLPRLYAWLWGLGAAASIVHACCVHHQRIRHYTEVWHRLIPVLNDLPLVALVAIQGDALPVEWLSPCTNHAPTRAWKTLVRQRHVQFLGWASGLPHAYRPTFSWAAWATRPDPGYVLLLEPQAPAFREWLRIHYPNIRLQAESILRLPGGPHLVLCTRVVD